MSLRVCCLSVFRLLNPLPHLEHGNKPMRGVRDRWTFSAFVLAALRLQTGWLRLKRFRFTMNRMRSRVFVTQQG